MGKRVLVVDDEREITALIASLLRDNKFDVMTAFDSVQAMLAVRNYKPDLIILDIKMPAGGGVSVFEKLKLMTPTEKIPVMFITAFPSGEMREKLLEMGAVDYITKPFSLEELLIKVKSILNV